VLLYCFALQVVSWQFFDAPTGLYPQLWCPEGVLAQLLAVPAASLQATGIVMV
jgi:hypothetical protein